MPKDMLPINFFEGGYNSASTPRDIADNQISEAINVDTSVKGAVKCLGEFHIFLDNATGDNGSVTNLNNIPVLGGYGMAMWSIERELTSTTLIADPGGYYLAIYNPSAASPRILFYNDPKEDANVNVINNAIGDITLEGSGDGSLAKTQFISVDGGLRIYDKTFQFKPHRLGIIPKGRHLFRNGANNSANDKLYANEEWFMDKQFVRPPTGGTATLDATTFSLGTTEVGLNVKSAGQQGTALVPVGWGKDENNPREFYFYASYVYDGRQESCVSALNTTPIKLGGGGQNGGTTNNDISFTPILNVGTNASTWNPRITGVRIYYRDKEYNKETKYLLGDFPTQTLDGTGISEDLDQGSWSGYIALAGEENAYSTDATLDLPINVGNHHKSPPSVFTHAVMSGLRNDTVSTECYYRTGCVVNRKLYVGNIKQKTIENPLEEIVYADRMLKSVSNRFDVLPDTEFIDVNIKDGEDIIKLAAFNNRLLQFKERTLYVIVVAGVEEYLEAKYDYMGITHPEACIVTDVGIAWVNKTGAYIFTGEGRPQNMVSGKIDKDEWASFITDNSIVGFDPVTMQFMIIKDCTNIDSTGETGTTCDMYIHNMLTGSWNRAVDKLGDGNNNGHDSMTNIVNYTDASGQNHCSSFIDTGNIVEWVSAKKYASLQSPEAYTSKPFKLVTKELTGGSPHLRKKFYKVYLTYKGNVSTNKPIVKAQFTTLTGNSTITLEAVTDFVDASSEWKSAQFKVGTSDLDAARNVYSIQVSVEGNSVNQDFEINDMSLIFRAKGVK